MTTVRLLKNGVEAFPAMFAAIQEASRCIAVEMYIIADDETGREFRDHLTAAAKRGILVDVLVDSWGSLYLPNTFWDGLITAGGSVKWFRPITRGVVFFRNHRKLLLIDDRVAYLGGMNIADEYYRGARGELPWRDNMLEIAGTGVAWLRRSFLRMWGQADSPFRVFLHGLRFVRKRRTAGGKNVRFLESGPENPMRRVGDAYRQVIQDAHSEIDLAMGYFYPHGRTLRALKRAVIRGVRVRLLFSQKTDVPIARFAARGLYGRMLRAGVEVWEYVPAMMHAKLAVAGDTVVAGSANLDIRSGFFNYELLAVVSDPALAARARADFEDDLKQSVRIRVEEWRKRPWTQKLKERISYFLLARADILISRMGLPGRMRKNESQHPIPDRSTRG
jgi:cardiolipin synthase